jgi:single-stranded DNA-specific DHH superfamily exonuclease
MTIPPEALEKARAMLQAAARPLIFHDDDPDGTCAFVMCYQFCKEGKSVVIKTSPVLTADYYRKVDEYAPDLVVVLDKPKIDNDFLAMVKTPLLWIDHHEPQVETTQHYPNVLYLNPRLWNDEDNRPTSYWTYQITKTNLWLATVGAVADWHIPDYISDFQKAYPDLLPASYSTVADLYLDTPIAKLIRIIQFNLKGRASEARKSILTLTRVESPYEILHQTTARGRFLYRKYETLAAGYEHVLEEAKAAAAATPEERILLYLYTDDTMTFTGELSNELLIRYPGRIILVGRKHDGYVKCSARSKELELPTIVTAALRGRDGYGGGHKNACGIVVAQKDWDAFYATFSDMVGKAT